MSKTAACLIAIASFVAGTIAAIPAHGLALDSWFGPAQVAILNQDIELGYGNPEGTTCPGSRAGGLLAGTPLVIRKHGAVKFIELRFEYTGKDLPAASDFPTPPPGPNKIQCVNRHWGLNSP